LRVIVHIFILIVVVSFFVIYNFSGANNCQVENKIVIVGNDTLGRNWDNLPSAKELEEARFKNNNVNNINFNYDDGFGQKSSSKKDGFNTFESVGFSNRINEAQNNRETIISENGSEIIVGTY